jgi:hypothetical protein
MSPRRPDALAVGGFGCRWVREDHAIGGLRSYDAIVVNQAGEGVGGRDPRVDRERGAGASAYAADLVSPCPGQVSGKQL